MKKLRLIERLTIGGLQLERIVRINHGKSKEVVIFSHLENLAFTKGAHMPYACISYSYKSKYINSVHYYEIVCLFDDKLVHVSTYGRHEVAIDWRCVSTLRRYIMRLYKNTRKHLISVDIRPVVAFAELCNRCGPEIGFLI